MKTELTLWPCWFLQMFLLLVSVHLRPSDGVNSSPWFPPQQPARDSGWTGPLVEAEAVYGEKGKHRARSDP